MNIPYYDRALAMVHHLAYGDHADLCAPGILGLLEPVLARGGLVLELGCGSGALTRHLVGAGHRVLATDASPAFIEIASTEVPGAEYRLLTLPDDPIPSADAIVAVGHVLNYLPTIGDLERSWVAIAEALAPDGVMAIDILTAQGAPEEGDPKTHARVEDDWAMYVTVSREGPARIRREITSFVNDGGSWRREDETHHNLLVDPGSLTGLLDSSYRTVVGDRFGANPLPVGMKAVTVTRADTATG